MEETSKSSRASTIFFNASSVVALGFAIAALVPPAPRSIPLIIILAFTSIVLCVSSWILHRNRTDFIKSAEGDDEDDEENIGLGRPNGNINSPAQFYTTIQTLMRPSLSTNCLFYASSLTLIITLTIRLFSYGHFGGQPSRLDFGPKVSKNGPGSDTNIALSEFTFDNIGHLVQGIVAAILSYPAVTGILSKLFTKISSCMKSNDVNDQPLLLVQPNVLVLVILQLLHLSMTIYPSYSMVKRLRYSSFAQTSHANNTTEWCLGCILGVSLGRLISALLKLKLKTMGANQEERSEIIDALVIGQDTESEEGSKKYGFGKAFDYKGTVKYPFFLQVVEIFSILMINLFSITVLLTGIFMGLSWNYEEENSINAVMVAVFMCIYVIVLLVFFSLARLS